MEVAFPINTCYTVDCCRNNAQQSKDRNTEQNTVSFLKDKQCFEEDNEVCHSMMISGASKLSDQVRRHIVVQNIFFKHLQKYSSTVIHFSVFATRILG